MKKLSVTGLVALFGAMAATAAAQDDIEIRQPVADTAVVVIEAGVYRPTMEDKYEVDLVESVMLAFPEMMDEDEKKCAKGSWKACKSLFFEEYDYKKRSRGHWAGIGAGYVRFVEDAFEWCLSDDAEFLAQSKNSMSVSLNFFDYSLAAGRHFLLTTGLGTEINNFNFEYGLTIARLPDGQTGPVYMDDLVKTKLVTWYLNVPLLAEFQFGYKNKFFVNVGGVMGVRLSSHTKYKVCGEPLQKQRDNFNMRDFHFGITGGVGYGCFGLTATYYPVSVFKDGKGPDVRQANIGLALYL